MNPSEGKELPAAVVHGIGVSWAQLTGSLVLVKFPLSFGFSVPAHIAPAYKSERRYLKPTMVCQEEKRKELINLDQSPCFDFYSQKEFQGDYRYGIDYILRLQGRDGIIIIIITIIFIQLLC
jgi:hypothetical protein